MTRTDRAMILNSTTTSRMSINTAVLIVGPTGVGKTGVAIRLAESLGTEIVSADSRQVYRELTIGTAVPEEEQRKRVRHHLLQHRSVTEDYNASMFEEEALQALSDLFEKYGKAVVCGGSGLYIRAICQGIDDIPAVDPEVRRTLLQRMKEEGPESLRFELKKLDPVSYRNIDLRNPMRILKALEISLSTGRPYSGFLTRGKKKRDFQSLKIGLNIERNVLYNRINYRVDEMIEKGLLEEVRTCMEYCHLNALNTVGYRELFDHLDGNTSLPEAVDLIKRNSRRYARRQLTWFNRDQDIHWFEPGQVDEIIKFAMDAAGQ
jgi:tRNA dimethylallyltransferase